MVQDLVIGIDVGGQTAKCGVVDARGNIVAQTVISSENTTNADEFVTALAEALNRIIVEAKAEGSIREHHQCGRIRRGARRGPEPHHRGGQGRRQHPRHRRGHPER